MRCKLLTLIKNWEASGQGDGGMDREQDGGDDDQQEEEDELDSNAAANVDRAFGSLAQRPARALDSRAAFLRGMPPYILYYWEVAESQQLLSSCLQRLSSHANAADAMSVPVVSRRGGSTLSRGGGETLASRRGRGGTSSSSRRGTTLFSRRGGTMSAGSSITSGGSGSSPSRSHRQSTDKNLITSLQDLADSQRGLLSDRALDREHQERENTRKRRFDRHSFLVDEARTYRMKIAEFSCVDDDRSRRMLQFYTTELSKLEEEIQQLDYH
jgi:hypothetical protein